MTKAERERKKASSGQHPDVEPGVQSLHLDSWSGVLCTAASKTLL